MTEEIYDFDPHAAADTDFVAGELSYIEVGNRGRLLDARRTPITITAVIPVRAAFEVEIGAFEDAGARWELPLEARRLGRSPSTVSRELRRNADRRGEYRPSRAHALAWQRASRPKPAKLAVNLKLREIVEQGLARKYSPAQIAARLRMRFPANPEMWVSAETIYQSLYVTSRGALKRELTAHLRTGRTLRKPSRRTGPRRNRIPDMVNIADRPQEADDRAIPGHWEGDLLLGKNNKTAIGTLVERATATRCSCTSPTADKAEQVAPAITAKIKTLPESLRRSLT